MEIHLLTLECLPNGLRTAGTLSRVRGPSQHSILFALHLDNAGKRGPRCSSWPVRVIPACSGPFICPNPPTKHQDSTLRGSSACISHSHSTKATVMQRAFRLPSLKPPQLQLSHCGGPGTDTGPHPLQMSCHSGPGTAFPETP